MLHCRPLRWSRISTEIRKLSCHHSAIIQNPPRRLYGTRLIDPTREKRHLRSLSLDGNFKMLQSSEYASTIEHKGSLHKSHVHFVGRKKGGATLDQICRAATWASQNTFSKHYRLDIPKNKDLAFGRKVLQSVIPP